LEELEVIGFKIVLPPEEYTSAAVLLTLFMDGIRCRLSHITQPEEAPLGINP
jgi:hypothetical protein